MWKKTMIIIRKGLDVVIGCYLLLLLALTLPVILGYQAYAVTSGSMEPAIKVGDLIYVKNCPAEEIKVGEIITFLIRGASMPVTHRVYKVEENGSFRTKGDANRQPDGKTVARSQVLGTVEWVVPHIGFGVLLFGNLMGKLLLGIILVWLLIMELVAADISKRHSLAAYGKGDSIR